MPNNPATEKLKAVLILESQPPHIGEMLQIITQLERFDFLYVCIEGPPMVMPVKHALTIWMALLKPYKSKIQLVKIDKRFNEALEDELPDIFNDCIYVTASRETYVHLSSLNVEAELIPSVNGYHGIFERNAYRQSRALSWLEAKVINSVIYNKLKNKR